MREAWLSFQHEKKIFEIKLCVKMFISEKKLPRGFEMRLYLSGKELSKFLVDPT